MLLLCLPYSTRADNTDNYPEMRSDRDGWPEGMNDDPQGDLVRIIPDRMSDICVREFGVSPVLALYTNKGLRADPSLFRSISTLLWWMSHFVREENNLNR